MMNSPAYRKVAVICGDGHIIIKEEKVPKLEPGTVKVQVYASLISPGTELGGWRSLLEKRLNPDPNMKPHPFGYSNSGVVLDIGEGVSAFQAGERIAWNAGRARSGKSSQVRDCTMASI